jgi:DNA-binding CsgD family transcriptional regulator/tetratricopeptide (TPR) repeat protein
MRNAPKLIRKSAVRNPSAAFANAEAAYREADYDLCRGLIDGAVPIDRAERGAFSLLRARSAHAQNDAERAYAAAAAALAELDDPQLRLLATILRGASAKALGKTREARASFEEASRDIFRFPSADVGVARHLLAVEALEGQDFVRADALARENIAAGTNEAQSLALLGTIANKRERYAEAANYFASALRKFQASGDVDVRLEADIVSALAVVATETVDLRLVERVRKAYEKLAWTPSLAALRFRAVAALRLGALLEGDVPRAYFTSRDALGTARGSAQQALAEINAAVASRLLGDAAAERLQLRRGWEALRDERFEASDDEARLALLTFIAEAADSMPAEARKGMTLYRSSTPKSAGAGLTVDRRFVALEAQAAARLADAGGDEETAIRFYEHAFSNWRALGFGARAALAALDLRRLTGDESYAAVVRSVLSRAPKAWFAKQLRAPASPVDLLSPAERTVLGYLLGGDSAKTIAAKLDRSPFTISNHTRKIFQAFELNSRGKVIARCAELGITASKIERESR